MTKAYYSTIFQQAAPEVWKIIRDFNNYPVWVGGCGESRIEDGKPGETVGAIRDVLYRGRRIRQSLLALSDVERTQTYESYEFCGAPTLPVTGFQATLRVTPVIDGDRAFVEWCAMFDCELGQREELATTQSGWFANARIAAGASGGPSCRGRHESAGFRPGTGEIRARLPTLAARLANFGSF